MRLFTAALCSAEGWDVGHCVEQFVEPARVHTDTRIADADRNPQSPAVQDAAARVDDAGNVPVDHVALGLQQGLRRPRDHPHGVLDIQQQRAHGVRPQRPDPVGENKPALGGLDGTAAVAELDELPHLRRTVAERRDPATRHRHLSSTARCSPHRRGSMRDDVPPRDVGKAPFPYCALRRR